jgi:hypothetical protein
MQIFYTNIKTRGENGVSSSERNEMRNAIVDYGALHHTPTHDNTSTPNTPRATPTLPKVSNLISPTPTVQHQTHSRQQTEAPSQGSQAPSHREDTPSSKTYYDFTDIDIFSTDYTISNAEMEAVILSSTQDFWALLPGEVEMY